MPWTHVGACKFISNILAFPNRISWRPLLVLETTDPVRRGAKKVETSCLKRAHVHDPCASTVIKLATKSKPGVRYFADIIQRPPHSTQYHRTCITVVAGRALAGVVLVESYLPCYAKRNFMSEGRRIAGGWPNFLEAPSHMTNRKMALTAVPSHAHPCISSRQVSALR